MKVITCPKCFYHLPLKLVISTVMMYQILHYPSGSVHPVSVSPLVAAMQVSTMQDKTNRGVFTIRQARDPHTTMGK